MTHRALVLPVLLAACGPSADPPAQPLDLVRSVRQVADKADGAASIELDPEALARLERLAESWPEGSGEARLLFGFDKAAPLAGSIQAVDRPAPETRIIRGRLTAPGGGDLTVVLHKGVVAAQVEDASGTYVIDPCGTEGLALRRETGGPIPPDEVLAPEPGGRKGLLPPNELVEDGSRIDLLVLYTKGTAEYCGGEAAVEAVAYANQSYLNEAFETSLPGANPALAVRIVAIEAMPDDQPSRLSGLNRSRYVRERRDAHRADLVLAFHHRYRSAAGVAVPYCGDPATHREQSFVALVSARWLTYYMTPTHEIGHLLGGGHNQEDRGVECLYENSRGHDFIARDQQGARRHYGTIMSYKGDIRIKRFSNPDVRFQGVPTGTRDSYNARAIHDARFQVANYRIAADASARRASAARN